MKTLIGRKTTKTKGSKKSSTTRRSICNHNGKRYTMKEREERHGEESLCVLDRANLDV